MGLATPSTLTSHVSDFCEHAVPGSTPVFVPVQPAPSATRLDCFSIVANHVAMRGGTVHLGWQISEWPGVMLEAELHAVWRDAAGELLDLTPRQDLRNRTLFIHDPNASYSGRQVPASRRAIGSDPAILALFAAADDIFDFLNRGARATQHAIALTDQEALELHSLRAAHTELLQKVSTWAKQQAAAKRDPDVARRERNLRKKKKQLGRC